MLDGKLEERYYRITVYMSQKNGVTVYMSRKNGVTVDMSRKNGVMLCSVFDIYR